MVKGIPANTSATPEVASTCAQLTSVDLVLILHENVPRNKWPLGLVKATYPGTDGLVRSVQLKTASGLVDRPVSKVCLLEANLVNQQQED